VKRNSILDDLREIIDTIAADRPEQEQWALHNKVPAEEISLQIYDADATYARALHSDDVITDDCYEKFRSLVRFLEPRQGILFPLGWKISDSPDWVTVRQLAREIQRELPESGS
jgi:hypothetical protein